MENLPPYTIYTFIAVVLTALGFLYYALDSAAPDRKNFIPTIAITFIVAWLFVLAIFTFNDFFLDFESQPPRFLYVIGPPLVAIIVLFYNKTSRAFLLKMPITTLTYIHIVRVPVEMVLWWLAAAELIPDRLTFEGVNYDILSGISAPFAGLFLVGMRSKSHLGAIAWNIITLALVLNIVFRAISATPYFYDPAAYNVPNTGVFYFPFILLPGFIVPVVIFSHLVSLLKLLGPEEEEEY